jgi:DNA invertase Pin-like site-specific DNA recombinase
MNTMRGYVRVSTTAQDLKVQKAELVAAGVSPDRIYEDKATGKNADRPGLKKLREQVQPGDQVVVYKIDRVARSLRDLLNVTYELGQRGVGFRSLHDPINIDGHTDDPMAQAMADAQFQMLGVFAQLERAFIVGRTAAGREFAAAEDKRLKRPSRFGRKPKLSGKQLTLARSLLKDGEHDLASAAELLGVHRTTLYRYLEHEGKRTR